MASSRPKSAAQAKSQWPVVENSIFHRGHGVTGVKASVRSCCSPGICPSSPQCPGSPSTSLCRVPIYELRAS